MREQALTSAVGAPIVVEGRVWGVMTVASTEQPLPSTPRRVSLRYRASGDGDREH